ncbi:MAG TPA: sigma-70 family RNA polymerase sigma factor [Verrucomicrobiae bacterium]
MAVENFNYSPRKFVSIGMGKTSVIGYGHLSQPSSVFCDEFVSSYEDDENSIRRGTLAEFRCLMKPLMASVSGALSPVAVSAPPVQKAMVYAPDKATDQQDPDAILMLRVKDGDMVAFETLVERYKQPLINLLYRTLPDATEAEDLAQNVFIQVYKSAHRYEASARFSTWLFTIARNLCLNEIRRRSRHPAESMDVTHPENEDQPLRQIEDVKQFAPPDTMLQGELTDKVEEAIASLPENQRTAMLLCRQDDLSYDDIAKVLGCSLSATKSLIHRARETLKQRLKPYLKTGSWKETL